MIQRNFFLIGLLSALSFFLSGCATSLFDTVTVNKKITPQLAVDEFNGYKNQNVFWGGVILSGRNLKDKTELEVLAYPLDAYDEPLESSPSLGRFIAVQAGYLELGEFAKDRRVSMVAELVDLRNGRVGESDYRYPVITVKQLKLWPVEIYPPYDDSDMRFHFGVGIFHRY